MKAKNNLELKKKMYDYNDVNISELPVPKKNCFLSLKEYSTDFRRYPNEDQLKIIRFKKPAKNDTSNINFIWKQDRKHVLFPEDIIELRKRFKAADKSVKSCVLLVLKLVFVMFLAQFSLTIALLILADKLEDNLSLIVRLISGGFCLFTFCVFVLLYAFVWKWHNKNRALRRYTEVKKFNLEVMRLKRARIVTPKYFSEPWMAFRPLTSYHPNIYTS